jgi:transcriptional regulator with XRE-family HTH domain
MMGGTMIGVALKSGLAKQGGYVQANYEDKQWFAQRLRKALGETPQAEIIALMKENGFEITQQRLSHLFQGRNYPDPVALRELVRALDVSSDWLLGLTDQPLPAADLNEMLSHAKGEGRINKLMRSLPQDKQAQVLQFAEFLQSRQAVGNGVAGSHAGSVGESQQIARDAERLLDLIERTRGLDKRHEVERLFRDKNLIVDDGTT